MHFSKATSVLTMFLLAGCAGLSRQAAPAAATVISDAQVDTAKGAAASWLALVDAGNYDESWRTGSSIFKAAVTQAQWRQALEAVRRPLGVSESRTLKSAKRSKTLPAAPDGDYVVIEYDSAFSSKLSATELVTMAMDGDGTWRVAGYFIR